MISIKHTIHAAMTGLRTNYLRSAFTVLGMVIGIGAVILIVSLGESAKGLILSQVEGLGSNTLTVIPGQDPQGPSDVSSLFVESLQERELEALMNKTLVPTLADATPDVFVPGLVTNEGNVSQGTIVGTGYLFSDILGIYPAEGLFFSEEDVEQSSRVAVIGQQVKKDLFGMGEALGKQVKIKGTNFRVVGIYGDEGTVALFEVDRAVLIPWSAAHDYLTGTSHFNEIIVRATSEDTVERTKFDIEATLRELHDITDPEKDNFSVITSEDLIDTISVITNVMTLLLGAIAAISLLVGGIGIMNIMFISIAERTREIGLRKALGATEGNVLAQFLWEAVLVTGAGGVIGVIVGAGLAFVVAIVLNTYFNIDWSFVLPVYAVVLGVGVAAGIGLLFGLYPARKAAQKDPITSLRYE